MALCRRRINMDSYFRKFGPVAVWKIEGLKKTKTKTKLFSRRITVVKVRNKRVWLWTGERDWIQEWIRS